MTKTYFKGRDLSSSLLGLSASVLLFACGKATLEPVGAEGENGGSAGAAASGNGGSAGSGASSNGGSSSGASSNGGSAGAGGSSGSTSCLTPNPAGCLQSGCPGDQACDAPAGECFPEECTCQDGEWSCVGRNCGEYTAVPACVGATYYVRFGYVQGQENTADFCVAYQDDSGEQPLWEPVGLMEANGYLPEQFEGLDKLSRYLPLKQKPLYFTKASQSCAAGGAAIKTSGDSHYFTFLSVPYSHEADQMWVIADAEPTPIDPGFGGSQIRIQNLNFRADTIDVSAHVGDGPPQLLGSHVFGNPKDPFIDAHMDHVEYLVVNDGVGSGVELSWIGWDLLPLYHTTVFISGDRDVGYRGLGCIGSNPVIEGSDYSNCFFVDQLGN